MRHTRRHKASDSIILDTDRVKRLAERVHIGECVYAHVIKRLAHHQYLIRIRGIELIAEGNDEAMQPTVIARVEALSPKVALKLMSVEEDRAARLHTLQERIGHLKGPWCIRPLLGDLLSEIDRIIMSIHVDEIKQEGKHLLQGVITDTNVILPISEWYGDRMVQALKKVVTFCEFYGARERSQSEQGVSQLEIVGETLWVSVAVQQWLGEADILYRQLPVIVNGCFGTIEMQCAGVQPMMPCELWFHGEEVLYMRGRIHWEACQIGIDKLFQKYGFSYADNMVKQVLEVLRKNGWSCGDTGREVEIPRIERTLIPEYAQISLERKHSVAVVV